MKKELSIVGFNLSAYDSECPVQGLNACYTD